MRKLDEQRLQNLASLVDDPLTLPVAGKPINASRSFTNWTATLDDDGIAWAVLDVPGKSANTLSAAVLGELGDIIDDARAAAPKALVIRSAKRSGFVAGAEIGEFAGMGDEAQIIATLNQGLQLTDRLGALPFPTIAMIHGFCLGGGLELALACKWRVATPQAKFAFPEVMLGLHPGLAGTWRSLKLAPPVEMMTMMLTGKSAIAGKAKRLGLVDAVTQERHFAEAIAWIVAGKLKKRDARGLSGKALSLSPIRQLVASRMEKATAAKVRKDHYPAPFAMIDLWREHGGDPAAMRTAETASFARLMRTETSRNLVRAFFLRERLKGYAKGHDHGIAHVHVIGAGVMGGDIAAWSALRGFRVTLQDRDIKYIAPAIKRADKLFQRRLYTEGDRRAALDRLMPDPQGYGLAKADLIIEAVPENPDIKHAVYKQCQAAMKADAILATNTSSILLENLRKGLKKQGHFCGIHFFNPVAKMPLVEIVTHDRLDDAVAGRVAAFIAAIDKLPLPVKSAPGFLVNRALAPYLMEAFVAYSEGVRPEVIDAAAEQFGMPMGPIELADTVGLDVGLHVARVLKADLKRDMPDIPDWFEKLVADGNLGKKTGKGIYQWKNGKPQKAGSNDDADPDLADRLILPLVNAVADCLADGVVEDGEAADAGMIFGAGFAPFRGGPVHYAKTRGIDDVVAALERLEKRFGARFAPSRGWKLIV